MSSGAVNPQVHGIFDPTTWTVTYVVYEKTGSACAIIDSVLDYDPKSGRTSHKSADKVIEFVKANDLKVQWILETHAHADHLTAAPYLKSTWVAKPPSATTSVACKKCSRASSTWSQALSTMAHSLTIYLPMAKLSPLAV